jgi:hypothetical protein
VSLPPENIGDWDATEGQISRASFIATVHRSRSFQKNSSFRPGTKYVILQAFAKFILQF